MYILLMQFCFMLKNQTMNRIMKNKEVTFYDCLQDIRHKISSIECLVEKCRTQNAEQAQPFLIHLHLLLGSISLLLECNENNGKTSKENDEIKTALFEVNKLISRPSKSHFHFFISS